MGSFGDKVLGAFDQQTRNWIYRVVVAVAGVLVATGQMVEGDVSAWLTLAAAVLGAGGSALAIPGSSKKVAVNSLGE